MKSKKFDEGNKWLKEYCIFNYIILITIFSITIFLYGYFPTGYNEGIVATGKDIPHFIERTRIKLSQIYVPVIKKLVIMVIDALRWDFVTGEEYTESMKLTNSLLNNGEGCLYQMKVNSPTVTMPRIKAITTGSVPNFIDVVLNLGADAIAIDNILLQAKKYGYKPIFYGDDTWLKLFPNIFDRFEGTTSFYVSDYTEVDNNVTRNVKKEIPSNDWTIMITHYLGLDHIGHIAGPSSPLIKSKLKEMDNVISLIYQDVRLWKMQHEPTLFIILGDHGMKDSGGHGGASFEETTVPLIALGRPCLPRADEIDQIDLAPTLALLLGVPIPYSSLGTINLEMMDEMNLSQKLFAFYYNADHLFLRFQKISGYLETDAYKNYQNAIKLHAAWLNTKSSPNNDMVDDIIQFYKIATKEMKNSLMGTLLKYDLHSMIFAMMLLCHILFLCLPTIGISSTTNVQFLTLLIINYMIWILLNRVLDSESHSVVLLPKSIDLYFLCVIIPALVMISFNCFLCGSQNLSLIGVFQWSNLSNLQSVLVASTIMHTISLSSSSFVEEEHQTWYFFWITLMIYIGFSFVKKMSNKHYLKLFIAALSLIIAHRVLRKLNSTGDKYAHLPDIEEWLQEQDSNLGMTVILTLGLVLLLIVDFSLQKWRHRPIVLVLDSAIVILIYVRHTINGAVMKMLGYNPTFRGIVEINCFWGFVLLYTIYSLSRIISSIRSNNKHFLRLSLFSIIKIWVIVSCLLHRPHNVILLPTQIIVGIFVHYFTKSQNYHSIKIFLYLWSSNAFYFYQGNSNSIATIDVAAGYVGLTSYQMLVTGIFLIINTYSAIVLGFLMYLYDQSLLDYNLKPRSMLNLCKQYAFWRLVPMTFYTFVTSFQRYHLFVWTVFSPKLLYEAAHCIVLFTVMFTLQVIFLLNDKLVILKK